MGRKLYTAAQTKLALNLQNTLLANFTISSTIWRSELCKMKDVELIATSEPELRQHSCRPHRERLRHWCHHRQKQRYTVCMACSQLGKGQTNPLGLDFKPKSVKPGYQAIFPFRYPTCWMLPHHTRMLRDNTTVLLFCINGCRWCHVFH